MELNNKLNKSELNNYTESNLPLLVLYRILIQTASPSKICHLEMFLSRQRVLWNVLVKTDGPRKGYAPHIIISPTHPMDYLLIGTVLYLALLREYNYNITSHN